MNPLLRAMLSRFQAPAGDDGSDTGGTATLDRGDDFFPDADKDADKPADKEVATKDDADPEGEDEDGDDKDAKGKRRDSRIPLKRHEQLLAKERSYREVLERQLAQYQNGQRVAQTNEQLTKMEDSILGMEKEYNRLLAEGEIGKATELMSQIRRAERSIGDAKAEYREQVIESRAREAARYDIVLERIEESYPELNEDSPDYDSDMVQDVLDLKRVYQGRGMTPTKALQEAVKKLLGQEGREQKTATEVAPRVSDKDVATERKRLAVGKTADAVRRTPPNAKDIGMDSDKAGGGLSPKDVMSMSQEEFAKLTEDQLSRLRGDTV